MVPACLRHDNLRCGAEVLQRLRPCRDSAPRKSCCAGLGDCPALAASSVERRHRCETGGGSYLMVAECPEAQGHRLAQPRQRALFRTSASHAFPRLPTQWRSQNTFTGVARVRPSLTQGWRARLSLLRLQIALDQAAVLGYNSFILDRQFSPTMKKKGF